jgi:hypothetical protein
MEVLIFDGGVQRYSDGVADVHDLVRRYSAR